MNVVIEGTCDARFRDVRDAFASNFERDLELGAALSVSIDGHNVIDIWGGFLDEAQTRAWQRDSLACIFSCTKGVVAVLALMLADRGLIDLDAPVARYWPEFAQNGKGEIPVRWLLTHQSALSAIDAPLPFGSLSNWDLMIDALAAQAPVWTPGDGHGYHGVTYGHLVGEVVRRVTGLSCGTAMRQLLCDPLDLDIHMPLPEHEEARTADMVLGMPTAARPSPTFFDHWKPGDLGPKSFRNPPDCVFEIRPDTIVPSGKHRDHDMSILALQNADIIADIGHEIPGLVRQAKPGYVFREPGAINLTSHDLQHLLGCLLAHGLSPLDLFKKSPHIFR